MYVAVSTLKPKQHPADYKAAVSHTLAPALKLRFPEIAAIARISAQTVILEHGRREGAGDASTGRTRPSSRSCRCQRSPETCVARWIGRTASSCPARWRGSISAATTRSGPRSSSIATRPMTITAIIEDLPGGATDLETGIFASGLLARSTLAGFDRQPVDPSSFIIDTTTYLRLAPGASIETMRTGMPPIAAPQFSQRPPGLDYEIGLLRIDEAHLFPGLNPGGRTRVMTLAGIGLLTLLIAAINFINLATARASRRAREIAVRKTAGASRTALIVQFLGRRCSTVLFATCIGVALTELLLPWVNSFLQTGAAFDYPSDPALLGWLALGSRASHAVRGLVPGVRAHGVSAGDCAQGRHRAGRRIELRAPGPRHAAVRRFDRDAGVSRHRLSAAQLCVERRDARRDGSARPRRNPMHTGDFERHTQAAGCSQRWMHRGMPLSRRCFDNIRMVDGALTAYGTASAEAGVLESLAV